MQKQLDNINKRLDRHGKRLTTLERIMWVCVGVSLDSFPWLLGLLGVAL